MVALQKRQTGLFITPHTNGMADQAVFIVGQRATHMTLYMQQHFAQHVGSLRVEIELAILVSKHDFYSGRDQRITHLKQSSANKI
jgi:hypothetical protein